jgi:hypothetical protein
MRLAATGLVLAVLVAIGAPLYTMHVLNDDGEPGKPFDFHPPKTEREHAAATLTLDFAAAMQRQDAKAACRLAADQAARALRCTSAHPKLKHCGTHIYEAKEEDDETVATQVAFCALKVRRGKVVEYQPVGGLA